MTITNGGFVGIGTTNPSRSLSIHTTGTPGINMKDNDAGSGEWFIHVDANQLRFFDEAINCAKSGVADAIVTGPIHKTSWKLAGCRFAGHTDKIASDLDVKRYTMAFVGGGLRVHRLPAQWLADLALRDHAEQRLGSRHPELGPPSHPPLDPWHRRRWRILLRF